MNGSKLERFELRDELEELSIQCVGENIEPGRGRTDIDVEEIVQ